MNKLFTSVGISLKIWFITAVLFAVGLSCFIVVAENSFSAIGPLLCFIASVISSLPALIGVLIVSPIINRVSIHWKKKFSALQLLFFLLTIPYGIAAATLDILAHELNFGGYALGFMITATLVCFSFYSATAIATLLLIKPLYIYLNHESSGGKNALNILSQLFSYTTKTNKMETQQQYEPASQQPNKILIKGIITGGLILVMLIPTLFIYNLVEEREARQKEVVKEVSSKWATAQTLSAPFLVVPYTDSVLNIDGKTVTTKTKLILLANDVNVNGKIMPEERPRSIYKVLLYRSTINMAGDFKVTWPGDINLSNVDYANAKMCFTLSDFKGIEENIYININGIKLLMTPGLPVDDFGKIGLSVPVSLSPESITASIPFFMQVKIKGSERLHFIPMSASSSFALKSVWPSPSFDGDMLPNERQVSDSGFSAKWSFNQANLPFAKVTKSGLAQDGKMAFGVSLVQPADQYNKTMRSVKYAILFIGLTFAFFFIIELMQKKPFHPVQYVLVGLALVIFYTLLLSISEYILFDNAYLIAALATIVLISIYAQGHFKSWKTAGIFFTLLSCLYGFIFILIRLEDTALLVGTIGLFLVLALVMFASRKINWYGSNATDPILTADLK